jgi:hypothetical protein
MSICQSYKTFFCVTDGMEKQAKVFVSYILYKLVYFGIGKVGILQAFERGAPLG